MKKHTKTPVLTDPREIVQTIGRDKICAALDVTPQAVSNSFRPGRFPAAWKKRLDELAAESGVSLSWDAFRYREAAQ